MNEFNKIIGYENVKNELGQIIDMFKNKEIYERMGAKLPKGVLLFGNPGLGKTMLADAFCKECGVATFVLRNTLTDDNLIGEVNSIFECASKKEKAIIFIDDMDKFGGEDDYHCDNKIFNTIQSNIDMVKDKDVLVIATVNDINILPVSLIRNGRFDRKINICTPNNTDAKKIIEYYLKQKRIDPNMNFEDVTKMINYTSCASLETIINEGAVHAASLRKDFIDIDDIVKAYIKDQYNQCNEEFNCSNEAIEKAALHEAGHIVVAEALKENSVGFVTIQASNVNIMHGFTHICEMFDRRPDNIAIALGGKTACELFYEGRCASGCQSDLIKAYNLVKGGISSSGTCGLAGLDFSSKESSELQKNNNEIIVHAELEKYMFKVKDILLKNKEYLLALAKEISVKRTLLYSDIRRIASGFTLVKYIL